MKKQKKGMKKALSMLLALAMIVTGINYTPKAVSAADGWTEISEFKHANEKITNLCYKVAKGEENQQIQTYDPFTWFHIYPKGLEDNTPAKSVKIYFDEGQNTNGTTPYTTTNFVKEGNHYNIGLGLNEGNTRDMEPNQFYSLRFVIPNDGGEAYDVVFVFFTGTPAEAAAADGSGGDGGDEEGNWQSISDSKPEEKIYYDQDTMTGVQRVVNIQDRPEDKARRIYFILTTPAPAAATVKVNGTEAGKTTSDMVFVLLSLLTKKINIVEVMDDSTGKRCAYIRFRNDMNTVVAEPDFVDLEVKNVDISYKAQTGEEATIKFTIHNNGKSITLDKNTTVLKYYKDVEYKEGASDNVLWQALFGEADAWIRLESCSSIEGLGANNNFAYDSDITVSYERTIQEAFLNAEKIRFGLSYEGIIIEDTNRNNNYYIWEAPVPQNVKVEAQNDNKTLHVTWEAPRDADEDNTYTYNVYLDGSNDPVNGGAISDTQLDITQEEAFDNIHTVVVKGVRSDGSMTIGRTAKIFTYSIDTNKWHIWDYGAGSNSDNGTEHNTDASGNTWYYYDGYGMKINGSVVNYAPQFVDSMIKPNRGYSGLYNSGKKIGEQEMPTVQFLVNMDANNQVIVNDEVLEKGKDYDTDSTDQYRISQEIFKLSDGETQKIFHIIFKGTGTYEGKEEHVFVRVMRIGDVPPIEGLYANLTRRTDGTLRVSVGWRAVDENTTNDSYTYEVWIDGEKRENVTFTPSQDKKNWITTFDNLDKKRHRVDVKRIDKESGVEVTKSTWIVVYDPSGLTWQQWTKGRTQDIDNDTWWYTVDAYDGTDLDINYMQITTDGEKFRFLLGKGGTAQTLKDISEVVVSGTPYEVVKGGNDKYDAMVRANNDQIYLDHSLFPMADTVKERIFTVTVTGTLEGQSVIKTFLVKLINEDYATIGLKYVNEEGKETTEKDGHVVCKWEDKENKGQFGYNIYYYDPKNDYDPNKADNEITTIHLDIDDCIDGDKSFSYHFTENEIYVRSNTKVTVKAVTDADGTEEEIGEATAQAELMFYGEPYASPGAYVNDTSNIVFPVINVGTGIAGTKALQEADSLQITLTEYTGADRKEIAQNTGNTNPNTFTKSIKNETFRPGEIVEATFSYKFTTRAMHYFKAEIDPNNWIYETDADENNVKPFEIAAAYRGTLDVTLDTESDIYTLHFSPDQLIFNNQEEKDKLSGQVKEFEVSYYDHNEQRTVRIPHNKITEDTEYKNNDPQSRRFFKFDLDEGTHIDSDKLVTLAVVYADEQGTETVVVFSDDTPFWQEREMEWKPVTKNPNGTGSPTNFTVAGQDIHIEYKVLDTSIKDLHFKDIISECNDYNTWYISAKINSNYKIISDSITNVYKRKADDSDFEYDAQGNKILDYQYTTTKLYFAQTTEEYCDTLNPEIGPDYQLQPLDGYKLKIDEDSFWEPAGGYNYSGNGVDFSMANFGLGKYYAMKIEDTKGRFVTIAWRVTTEEGQWYQVKCEDGTSDPSKLPVYFHDAKHRLNATYYFDCSDNGLSHIHCYGGAYLNFTLDTLKKLNTNATKIIEDGERKITEECWKIKVAKAKMNAEGDVIEPEDDAYTTYIGGSSGHNPGSQGTGTILLNLEPIMNQFIYHSDKSGEQRFCLFMRIYNDTKNSPDSYIRVPFLIRTMSPELAVPEKLKVLSGSSTLSVSFTETEKGKADDYLYDIYVDKQLVKSDIEQGGTYTVDIPEASQGKAQIAGSEFDVKLVAKWCYSKEEDDDHWYDADADGEKEAHALSAEVSTTYTVQRPNSYVEVLGFQMNTSKEEGAASEYMPSMRTVSKVSRQMVNKDDKICAVKSYGTIVAFGEVKDISKMRKESVNDGTSSEMKIVDVPATSEIEGWNEEDSDNYYYYAVSLKPMSYKYEFLADKYSYRAYAVLDDGSTVYGKNVYTIDTYDIAENLYQGQRMRTQEAHDFLYNDVLNLKNMYENAKSIGKAMLRTLNAEDKSTEDYSLVNTAYKDLVYYVLVSRGYTYRNRGSFTSRTLGAEKEQQLLEKLQKKTNTNEKTLCEWIQNNVGKNVNNIDLTEFQGFYQVVPYQWDNSIIGDRDYESKSDSQ